LTLRRFSRLPPSQAQKRKALALTLFMPRIGANHVDDALTPHDLAMFTNSLDAGANLHGTRPIGRNGMVESD
jgi:hypothetical protein